MRGSNGRNGWNPYQDRCWSCEAWQTAAAMAVEAGRFYVMKAGKICEEPTHAADIKNIEMVCPMSINGGKVYTVNFLSKKPCKTDIYQK